MFGGVDTHKDVHVAAALDELGRLLGTGSFPTTTDGLSAAVAVAAQLGRGRRRRRRRDRVVGCRPGPSPHRAGVDVREVMRPNRQHRRRYGKSDEADAIGAARAVLAGEAVGTPKAGTGQVEAIRLLRIARRSAMKARTQAGNQIHAVIDTAPEQLRRRFVGRSTADIVAEAARFRRRHAPTTPLEAARLSLRTLARRWEYLDDELAALDAQLDELTASTAPTLRAINGVGTQVATAVLAAAGDNPDRLRSSASFAALCGVSPIDASSGRQQHHRLNRYGDRHANWALHVDHHQPAPLAPADPGLHGPTTRRRTHPQDDHPLPQTTRRPRGLPRHHHRPRPPTRTRPTTTNRCLTSTQTLRLGTFSMGAVPIGRAVGLGSRAAARPAQRTLDAGPCRSRRQPPSARAPAPAGALPGLPAAA